MLTGAPGALYNEVYGLNQATLSILKEFREATTWDKGGEVVLRSGEQTGRVFFSGGRIAWVVASSIKQTFFGHITDKTTLSRDDLREVFESCKQSGDNFADTIVEWGLLDEPTLSSYLLEYVASCLVEVLSWPDLHAMGMPEARPFKGNLTFELETVLAKVLQQDQEKKLPFAGASVVELLDALDDDEASVAEAAAERAAREEASAEEKPAEEKPAEEAPGEEKPEEVRRGEVRRGGARRGEVRRGEVRRGGARRGQARRGGVRRGGVCRGQARRGGVRRGGARRGEVRRGAGGDCGQRGRYRGP